MSVTYSGATVTTANGYTFYTFSTIGTGSITFPSSTATQVLIVAGGGGGGGTIANLEGGGGGGGGAVGVGTITFSSGVSYTITVGGGGNGGVGGASVVTSPAGLGGNSSITGTGISETAYGGGYGASSNNQIGGSGGSGGGGNGYANSISPGTATDGTGTLLAYYGNSGGSGIHDYAGGGGGGAYSVGGNGAQNLGGNGGAGYTWSVNNANYGGGAGGGMNGTSKNVAGTGTPGTGGSGGGGAGGSSSVAAVAGTANTGGGGGGAYGGSGNGGNGGAGGSGIIIIAVAIPIPTPWGAYIAGYNTSTTLYDITGNGRHATIGGTGYGIGNSSGNRAAASVPYISGTTATTITWPSGSIPTTFTICSITRHTGTTNARILCAATTLNWLHGHDSTGVGVAYYDGYKTSNNNNASVLSATDWLVMCGTNGTNTTPNNILLNGLGVGTANGGTGNAQLTINNSTSVVSPSTFAFQQLFIWDSALTNDQLAVVSFKMMNYLKYGYISDVTSMLTPVGTPWGAYIAGNNNSTTLYDTTGNGRHATIGGTGYALGTSSGNGAAASMPYITGTTATTVAWPSGSIPTTFTICSITRYTGTTNQRILQAGNGANFYHGHNSSTAIGSVYYGASNTPGTTASSVSNTTDWLVMCGTNGTNTTPNNMLANGLGIGTGNGGSGNAQLSINYGSSFSYPSTFAFQQVIIWDSALTNAQLAVVSFLMTNYLATGKTTSILPTPMTNYVPYPTQIPYPWGAYIAGNNTTTTLYDVTGNGRHATISGTGYASLTSSGNGATAPVTYITGTTATKISWPTGAVPSTFTICSITRATTALQGRIFDASGVGANWLHGHWGNKSGVAYYGSNNWMTQSTTNASSVTNYTDWLVMCGTNGTNATPNNILANGVGVGTSNVGTGNILLTINNGSNQGEASAFAFQQVIIWNTALTNAQLLAVSTALTNYLNTGQMLYPWSPPVYNINNYGLLLYYPFDLSMGDYSTNTFVNNATAISNASIVGTQTMLNSGSAYFTGTTSYIQVPTQYFTTSNSGITIALWANATNATPSTGTSFHLVDFGVGQSNNNIVLGIQPVDGNGYNLYFTLYSGTIARVANTIIPFTVIANVWNHYCLTLTPNGSCSIYINGNLIYSATVPGSYPNSSANTSCLIGKSNFAGDPYFNGYINSFIVFNRILTFNEIAYLVSYPRYVRMTTSTSTTQVFSPIIDSANLTMYYPFANNTYNYANGSAVNDAVSIVSASFANNTSVVDNGSLIFTGTAGQVFQAPITTLTNNGVTFALWVKCTTISQSSFSRFFDFGDASGIHNVILHVDGATVGIAVYVNGGAVQIGNTTVYTLIDTNWHHYCLTMDINGNYVFYVDGLTTVSGTVANSIPYATMNKCYIGKSNYNGNGNVSAYFNSFVVFNRVLTTSEISYLFGYPQSVTFGTGIIVNGDFDATTMDTNTYTIISPGYTNTSGSTFASVPGWYFVTYSGSFNIYLANGSGSSPLPTTVNTTSSYCVGIQAYTTGVVNGWMYQIINIPISQLGNWQITFDALSTATNASPILTVNVVNVSSGKTLLTYNPTISTSAWNTYNCNFPTTTDGTYRIMFVYNSAGVSLTSTTILYLTNITIKPAITLQNFVTNGNFDKFLIGGATSLADNSNTSYTNGQVSTSTYFNGITGWTFDCSGSPGTSAVVVGAGNFAYFQGVTLLSNPQQYSLLVQQNTTAGNILNMTQQIYLTRGQYQLQYYAVGRPSLYNASQTLTVRILNGILTSSPLTLSASSTSFTKVQTPFSIATAGNYVLMFSFNQSVYQDSSIILTGVQITSGFGSYSINGTSITNNYAQITPKIGISNALSLTPNNFISNYYINGSERSLQIPFYMHGPRTNSSGFKANGIDTASYYQQNGTFDGSYGYVFVNSYSSSMPAIFANAGAQCIWSENTAGAPQTISQNAVCWYYYTFIYSGSATSGTIYVQVDDAAHVYFNNVAIGSTGMIFDQSYAQLSISNLTTGLNFIRIAAINTGGTAALAVAAYDSLSVAIAGSNSNWTWSRASTTYSTTALWTDYDGALPFYTYGSLTRYTIPSTYYGMNYSIGTSGSYTVFVFLTDGFVHFPNRNANMTLNIFAVGGGGGGGGSNSSIAKAYQGGGGGGEFVLFTHTSSSTIKFAAYIGAGGTGGTNSIGGTGGTTRITTSSGLNVTCQGGGGGGLQSSTSLAIAPSSGGSGGGVATSSSAGGASVKTNTTITGGTVISDLGNTGGGGSFSAIATYYYTSNGGGGALAVGGQGTAMSILAGDIISGGPFSGGAGGAGANPTSYSASVGFPSYYFAAGGGGSGFNISGSPTGGSAGAGGTGGGGGGGFYNAAGNGSAGAGGGSGYLSASGNGGSNTSGSPGGNGLTNSGSGGGGGFANGGNGGSGIVIMTVLTSQLV